MAHVIVVGCGNIGSHLIPHLGRIPGVIRVTLIDLDRYEEANLANQEIDRKDVGKLKAHVQASRLRRIRPTLQVQALAASVEQLPLGALRGDLILGCLDSRLGRMHLNQSAWRLGVPWIDAGVEPSGLLVRVNAYMPAEAQSCLECTWSDRDYEALETPYPCSHLADAPRPAHPSSGLGALAASLQIIEAQKFLGGHMDQVAFGRQILIDGAHHNHYLTSIRRNPRCRFDHAIWRIEKLRKDQSRMTLQEALDLAGREGSIAAPSWLTVERLPFVKRLICPGCGHGKSILRLKCSLSVKASTCSLCGQVMQSSGWDLTERLTSHLPAKVLRCSLKWLGLRNGEVITIGSASGERHIVIDNSGLTVASGKETAARGIKDWGARLYPDRRPIGAHVSGAGCAAGDSLHME